MQRISTGSRNIDLVLGGGIPPHSISLIAGLAGTGKTVLANQVIFFNADEENRAVYVATMSELVNKMLKSMQNFHFFDGEKVSTSIFFEDAGDLLAKEGLTKFVDYIFYCMKQIAPKFFVFDGVEMLSRLAGTDLQYQRFLYEVTGLLSTYACTSFWLGDYDLTDLTRRPECGYCDSVIYLSNERREEQDLRSLRMLKLSGSPFIPGEHTFSITEQGIRLYPRFLGPRGARGERIRSAESRKGPEKSLGIPFLDRLLQGGISRGSTTLMKGETGSGKTWMGLHFLRKGIEEKEAGLMVSMKEDLVDLSNLVAPLGWSLEEEIEKKNLAVLHISPVELNLDELALRILLGIKEVNAQRIFLNDFHHITWSFRGSRERLYDYLYSLLRYFKVGGHSTFLSWGPVDPHYAFMEDLVDSVVEVSSKKEEHERVRCAKLLKAKGKEVNREGVLFMVRNDGFMEVEV